MTRGRFLSKKISRDKRVAELIEKAGVEAGLLFTWLIAHLDREGRHDGDPAVVLGYVAPRVKSITVADVERALSAMHELGLIDWYEVNGDLYLSCPGFRKNQIGMRKNREAESDVPPPPDKLRTNSGQTPDKLRSNSGPSPAEYKVQVEGQVEVEETITDQPDGCQVSLVRTDPRSDLSAKVQTVWGAYRDYHQSCAGTLRSSRKEYKRVVDRLREGFTVQQLISAIHGYHASPFHQGQNDNGTTYLSLELICRDAPHVEKGIEMHQSPPRPKEKSAFARVTKQLMEDYADGNATIHSSYDQIKGLLPNGGKR